MISDSDIYALNALINEYIKLGVYLERILKEQNSETALNVLSSVIPIRTSANTRWWLFLSPGSTIVAFANADHCLMEPSRRICHSPAPSLNVDHHSRYSH